MKIVGVLFGNGLVNRFGVLKFWLCLVVMNFVSSLLVMMILVIR